VTTDGSHHHTNLLTASASTEILGEPQATTYSQAEPTGNATADDSAFAPKDGDVLGKVPGTSAAGHAAQSQIPQQAASAQAQTPVQPKELQEPAARPSASTDEPHATPHADKEQNAATAANASAAIHSPLQRGIVSAGEPTPAGSQSVVQTKVDVSQNAIQSSVSEVVHNSEPTAVDPVAGSGNPVPVSAGQTTQIPTANSPLEINPQQLVEKLGSAIHQAQENGGHLKIRLHPPELGTVQIEVSMRNGVLSARLEVQTAAAQQALTEHMGLLRDAIAQTGIHVDQIDVRIAEPEASDGSSQTDQQQQQQQQQFEQQSQQQPDGGEFDRENDVGIREPVTSAQASASLMDQLDIQV
jgi:flagellar hook-length control protein FliK